MRDTIGLEKPANDREDDLNKYDKTTRTHAHSGVRWFNLLDQVIPVLTHYLHNLLQYTFGQLPLGLQD